jgi:CheY-like chemotaxis protein
MKCGKTSANRHPMPVLIVDDDVDSIRFAQRIIAAACPQFCTQSVQSGEELICYLRGEHGFSDREAFPYPMLILLDLMMPGMHGFDVLAWLAKNPPHDGVPVVVLTGSGEVQAAQKAYSLGARSFLAKPLSVDEFQNTINSIGTFEKGPEHAGRPAERIPEP